MSPPFSHFIFMSEIHYMKIGRNKLILMNLSKLTVTLFKLGEGGIQDSQAFTIYYYLD